MREVATPGRWIWRASGLITTAVLIFVGTHLIARAGQPEYAQPRSTAIRTVTVPQPVTSLTVQSYGAPVQVTGAPVGRVQITETLMYDAQASGNISASPTPASAAPGGNLSASPAAGPPVSPVPPVPPVPPEPSALPSGAPAVLQSVSGGHLSLGDPECGASDCSVSFAVTVPSAVTVTVDTEGGSISVSGVAGANLDSGGGPVDATRISGPLTVGTDGGPLRLTGLAGPLSADTGGGPLAALGVASATATVSTAGGGVSMVFSAAPDSVTVGTDGGSARLAVPGGPYALTADSDGGPQSIGIATDPAAHRSITVMSDGGPLMVGSR
jgi:hypothetical protein